MTIDWGALLENLDEQRPPRSMDSYVEPERSAATEIARDLLALATMPTRPRAKFLLVGAKGGGKSTELRAVAAKLMGRANLLIIDLDASGVNATNVQAFDLLYICSLGLLRLLEENDGEKERTEGLYLALEAAYSGRRPEPRVGALKKVLSGLAGFAASVGAATAAFGGSGENAITTGLVMTAANTGLSLLAESPGVVAEVSPKGRALQQACNAIAERLYQTSPGPICVLVDGLEKINGGGAERYWQVFEQTRLIADAPWCAVIAAPPSSLSDTSSAYALGYSTNPVYGFAPERPALLKRVLELRLRASGVATVDAVDDEGLDRIVAASCGLPRHAVRMLREATMAAATEGADRINSAHIDRGIRKLAESLAIGLTEDHLVVLAKVHRSGLLPKGPTAGSLFASNRVLAHPPAGASQLPRFAVHPLLREDVIRFSGAVATPDSVE